MEIARAGYWTVDAEAAARGNRRWWHDNADDYHADHGEFLGDADFRWCPEGLREAEAQLLGDIAGADVLEIGAGAGQCSRWLRARGARVLATDIAEGMVRQSARIDARLGTRVPAVVADARDLPLADASFDVVFTAFGAIPFVADPQSIHAEVARVLRPGGRWVFAVVHPARWMFPDDPGPTGMTITRSYFDRRPYAELGRGGEVQYAEYHHTLADHVAGITGAGLHVAGVLEPEWQPGNTEVWGGWGPHRGQYLPGSAIFSCRRPA
ncbi:MAG TPA: class I SAM-dependent methyltransferase [Actinomycetaceae bacterium]|nr:class I SAM-dependent methyltransferase [Actinomycetaceae bacterium]